MKIIKNRKKRSIFYLISKHSIMTILQKNKVITRPNIRLVPAEGSLECSLMLVLFYLLLGQNNLRRQPGSTRGRGQKHQSIQNRQECRVRKYIKAGLKSILKQITILQNHRPGRVRCSSIPKMFQVLTTNKIQNNQRS